MSRKIFFHCGLPKTGTSAVQVVARSGAIAGLNYPPIGLWRTDDSHHSLVFSYFPTPGRETTQTFAELARLLRKQVSEDPRDVLISSESLAEVRNPLLFIEAIMTALDGLVEEPRIILAFRHYLPWLSSLYNQRVKDVVIRETRPPDAFARDVTTLYARVIERFRGPYQISPILYDPKETFVSRFFRLVTGNPSEAVSFKDENVSLSAEQGLPVTLALNMSSISDEQRDDAFQFARRRDGFFSPSARIFSDGACARIRRRLDEDRERIAESFPVLSALETDPVGPHRWGMGPREFDAIMQDMYSREIDLGDFAQTFGVANRCASLPQDERFNMEPADAEQLVKALYRAVLLREVDEPSLRAITQGLIDGRSAASVAEKLTRSEEFKMLHGARVRKMDPANAEGLVKALYKGMLLREPDEQNLRALTQSLVDGRSAASVAESFLESDEFKQRKAASSTGMDPADAVLFVTILYKGVLLRDPDEAGLRALTQALIDGRSPASVAEAFVNSEECKKRNTAKLFVPPGHFYSPVADPAEASAQIDRVERGGFSDSLPGIDISAAAMEKEWRAFLPFLGDIPFTAEKSDGRRYRFDNPAYGWGDGSILHAMIRRFKPARFVEIGSGWSSACAIDTIELCLGGACDVTLVEPYPKLARELIGETSLAVNIIERPVQRAPLSTFLDLEAGDFLLIDSTHVMRTGSDVCYELFEILPRLRPGVFVHIHDMFWPFEYPRSWAVTENRSWNEIYAVRALLTDNDNWDIVFFNDYFVRAARPLIEKTYPQFLRNSGGALWLRRR